MQFLLLLPHTYQVSLKNWKPFIMSMQLIIISVLPGYVADRVLPHTEKSVMIASLLQGYVSLQEVNIKSGKTKIAHKIGTTFIKHMVRVITHSGLISSCFS